MKDYHGILILKCRHYINIWKALESPSLTRLSENLYLAVLCENCNFYFIVESSCVHSRLLFNQISYAISLNLFQLKNPQYINLFPKKRDEFSQRNQGDFKTSYIVMILPLRAIKLENNFTLKLLLAVNTLHNVVRPFLEKSYSFDK